ncbi:hypothetical protein BDZ45DRAFT_753771 [Acephala macrosclerotiorum]|nr:hypothetical protein BDZ45DRAFT_753771 [Acephala macrosclerotiorum]
MSFPDLLLYKPQRLKCPGTFMWTAFTGHEDRIYNVSQKWYSWVVDTSVFNPSLSDLYFFRLYDSLNNKVFGSSYLKFTGEPNSQTPSASNTPNTTASPVAIIVSIAVGVLTLLTAARTSSNSALYEVQGNADDVSPAHEIQGDSILALHEVPGNGIPTVHEI